MTELTNRMVRTVLGDVPADQLGHVQPHEHVFVDVLMDATPEQQVPDSALRFVNAKVSLSNNVDIRRHPFVCRDNLSRFDVSEAIDEVMAYKEWGGGTLVDSSSIGLGRDPVGLAQVSRATGVHIVMGGGAYTRPVHPKWIADSDEDDIAEVFVRDAEIGVDGTGIRTGVLGEVGLSHTLHEHEERVLRAAVKAQRQTGLALQLHAVSFDVAMYALEIVADVGGAVDRTIMSHMDIHSMTVRSALELASTGAYVAYDLFGSEQAMAFYGEVWQFSDAQRIDLLLALIEAGHLERILISQDLALKSQTAKYGGEGFQHILESVLPRALKSGMSQEQVHQICMVNPAEVLALKA
ncbi:phosphotriesterase [Salinibacterium sp. ZJ450]|uniref:phosphotriesterase family protein n=1 Tax=Salinibacterium sp. ZJ450 TaxID=2708338 RepID=UPI00141FBAF7|nr:hypothetical protein [Salinibacterium sp. ZJ450]